MTLIQWTADLETGHNGLDDDHRALIAVINACYEMLAEGSGHGDRVAALEEMRRTASAHFAYEERLMGQSDYGATAEHSAAHAALLSEIDGLLDRYRDEPGFDAQAQIGARLRDWFFDHFHTLDRDLHYALKH